MKTLLFSLSVILLFLAPWRTCFVLTLLLLCSLLVVALILKSNSNE